MIGSSNSNTGSTDISSLGLTITGAVYNVARFVHIAVALNRGLTNNDEGLVIFAKSASSCYIAAVHGTFIGTSTGSVNILTIPAQYAPKQFMYGVAVSSASDWFSYVTIDSSSNLTVQKALPANEGISIVFPTWGIAF